MAEHCVYTPGDPATFDRCMVDCITNLIRYVAEVTEPGLEPPDTPGELR